MLKICLVIPTFKAGGMERVMSSLAKFLVDKNNEVHIIFLIRHTPFFAIDDRIHQHFPTGNYEAKSRLCKMLYWVNKVFFLRKRIANIKPDLVFSIPQGYSNLTILALMGTGIPVFISDRNSPAKPVTLLKRIARKFLYPYARGIVSQTNYAKNNLIANGIRNSNIVVIPNPLKKLTTYPKNTGTKKVILNVGRLVHEKNQSELIEIFAQINNPKWELHIVGDGPLKRELQNIIESRGLSNSVKLIGSVKNVDERMGMADIFAFTSIFEGFPNSLSEALAYPLPCIAYNCIAGPSELIEDGENGFLVEMGDRISYVEKLTRLMKNEQIRDRFMKSSVTHRDKYSMDIVGQRYLEFFLSSLDSDKSKIQ